MSDDLSAFSMLDLFKVEVESQAAVLNEGLLALESGGIDKEMVEPLMRAAHSVKGAARIVSLDAAVHVAHALEDVFVAAQNGIVILGPDDMDLLLGTVDLLVKISKITEADMPAWLAANTAALEEQVAALEAVKARPAGAPAAKKPAPAPAAPASVPIPEPVAETPPPAPAAAPAPAPVSTPAAKPTAAAVAAANEKSVVRVSAENINRLMGLAAEGLVEARRMQPYGDALFQLKQSHQRLSTLLEHLSILTAGLEVDERIRSTTMEAVQNAARCRQMLVDRLIDFEEMSRRSSILSDRLYREVIVSRMRPFADGVQGFPRMVRDLARQLNKKVRFDLVGKETEVDRDVLEKLEAPLSHLIRNALDHGLELPEDRLAAGKPEESTIRVEARHRAGMLTVTVSDDGRGVDINTLQGKIISKKMVTAEMALNLNEAELLEFLFLPGFSTKEAVSEISGRGVGLDVVQTMVQGTGGTIRVQNRPGKGLTFTLQLPITRSVLRALMVTIGGEPYAIPLSRIERLLQLNPAEIRTIEGRQYLSVDAKNVGLLSAAQILEVEDMPTATKTIPVVVIGDRSSLFGLTVDSFNGEKDIVVRPLDPRLGKLADVSAVSLTEAGEPLLVLDIDDMIRSIDALLSGGRLRRIGQAESAVKTKLRRILVVDDSITVREVERQLLTNKGYDVDVAVDGMDGWNAVRSASYDLVISDVDMPRLNGIDFVRRIKQDGRLKAIPVMIVSYKDREEDRLRGLDAGADHYLTKGSFHDDTLLQAVHDLIGPPQAV